MGTKIPLIKSLTRPNLPNSKIKYNINNVALWPKTITKVRIVEACHDGGPIAEWECPWCSTKVMQVYTGPLSRHLCPNCMKTSRLEAIGYIMKGRLSREAREKIGLIPTEKKRIRIYKYRKGPCFQCYATTKEPHKPTCKYTRKKIHEPR